MKLKWTGRGFLRGEFKDLYGKDCSIQESSLATDDAIWLGCDEGNHEIAGECLARMHLDRARAKTLIKLLRHFAKTGGLRK